MRYLFIFSLLFLLFACDKKKLPDISTDLVIDIPLDGSALEVNSNTTGIIRGAQATSNRKNEANKAMLFDGLDSNIIDFGAISASSFPSNIFTISCWIKVMDTSRTLAILSKRNAFSPFEYSLDNHFDHSYFTLDNWMPSGSGTIYGIDPLKAGSLVFLNTWHHIVFIADGQSIKVYTDGILQAGFDEKTVGNNFSATSASLVIGNGGPYAMQYYFTGAIDDIKMYSRALDDLSVQALFEL